MKTKLCRGLSLVLILTLAFCSGIPAMAVGVRTNYYIDSGGVGISSNGTGLVSVSFDVVGTGRMTKIGASTIYMKDASGTTVKTYTYPAYSHLQSSNRASYGTSITFYGTTGATYYAVVVLYAANSSGSGTLTVTSDTVVA